MTERTSTDGFSPSDALAAVDAGRENTAARVESASWWHHALVAVPAGGVVAAPAFGDGSARTVFTLVMAVLLGIGITVYHRRLGGRVNGFRRGRTRSLAWGFLAGFALLWGLASYVGHVLGHPAAFWVAGVLVAVLGTGYAVTWSRVFAAEVRAGR